MARSIQGYIDQTQFDDGRHDYFKEKPRGGGWNRQRRECSEHKIAYKGKSYETLDATSTPDNLGPYRTYSRLVGHTISKHSTMTGQSPRHDHKNSMLRSKESPGRGELAK